MTQPPQKQKNEELKPLDDVVLNVLNALIEAWKTGTEMKVRWKDPT